eukprot:ANDGO_01339.mRNA.1 hypothetical protein
MTNALSRSALKEKRDPLAIASAVTVVVVSSVGIVGVVVGFAPFILIGGFVVLVGAGVCLGLKLWKRYQRKDSKRLDAERGLQAPISAAPRSDKPSQIEQVSLMRAVAMELKNAKLENERLTTEAGAKDALAEKTSEPKTPR